MIRTPPRSAPAAPTLPPAVDVRGLTAAVDGEVVLSRLNLRLPSGALSGIVGPAGGGKSTLLRCLLGVVRPRAGELRVLGRPLSQARAWVAYVPQNDVLDWRFPLSVAEVVIMGRFRRLGLLRRPQPRDRAVTMDCLAEVGLEGKALLPVAELSVGERRRALLARALVQEPQLLLLDEPFQGVDARTEADLFALIRRLHRQGTTIVVATRDLAGAADRFEQVALLNGRILAQGSPAEVLTLEHLRAAYGPRLVATRVPATQFALDAGHP